MSFPAQCHVITDFPEKIMVISNFPITQTKYTIKFYRDSAWVGVVKPVIIDSALIVASFQKFHVFF